MNDLEKYTKTKMKTQPVPDFKPGDSLKVKVRITEGTNTRLQSFEGVVISRKNRDINSSFILRRIGHKEVVERSFMIHSNVLEEIEVIKYGMVRRAKLYYLRELKGKAARIKEDLLRRKNVSQKRK
jgi:large subunit ribosomal protein L19